MYSQWSVDVIRYVQGLYFYHPVLFTYLVYLFQIHKINHEVFFKDLDKLF